MESDVKSGLLADLADEELVVAVLLGVLPAFDELVRRFRPAVRLTVRRFAADTETVEDLCQEAFLRAFKALSRLEQPERFAAWLHAIARNLALRERRNGTRDQARFSALDHLILEESVAPDPSPAELFEQCEAHRVVREAVEALPLPYREVIYLHYWEGMPLSRVASYLGVPLSTAKWRLRYARELLRRQLTSIDSMPDKGEESCQRN
jgi:RNA polymerase sigma-70 factor (ECF subfamily)